MADPNTPSSGINELEVTTILQNHSDSRENYGALRDGVKEATLETLNELARKITIEKIEHEENAKKALKEAVQEKLKERKSEIKNRTDLSHLAALGNVEDVEATKLPLSENQETIQEWLTSAKPYIKEIPLIGSALEKMLDVRNVEKMWYGLIAKFGNLIPKEAKDWLPDSLINGPEIYAKMNLLRMDLEEARVFTKPRIGEVITIAEVTSTDLEILEEKQKEAKEKKTTGINIKQLVMNYVANERGLHPAQAIVISIANLFKGEEQQKQLAEKAQKDELVNLQKNIEATAPSKVKEVRFGEIVTLEKGILTMPKTDCAENNSIKPDTKTGKLIEALKANTIPNDVIITVTETENTKIEWEDGKKKMQLNMKNKDMFENLLKIADKAKTNEISICEIRTTDDNISQTEVGIEKGAQAKIVIKSDTTIMDKITEKWADLKKKDNSNPSKDVKSWKWDAANSTFIATV